ncbi:MAG: nuclear transport factor 2 family protein [Actinomycetota bacterium]|nr:nuclear transport factor 2 family protein [Actinomycetota bacterium]
MNEIDRLAAVHEITFMIFEQARLADLNRPDDQGNCFAEDAVANYYGDDIVGRKAITQLLVPALKKWVASCHTISNVQVDIHSDLSASSVSYVHAWHRINDSGEGDYEVRGQYHDDWVLTEQGWRIQNRTFLTMAATPPRPNAPGIGRVPSGN